MKRVLRTFIIQSISLYIVSQIAQGMEFEKGFQSLVFTGLALTVASFLVKPIVNLLLIPINLLTFNLFRFVGNAITLYLVDLILPEFRITVFHFTGLNSSLIFLPEIVIIFPISYLAFSLLISIISGVLHWLVR
ncbi:phage holin family protein [Candidatus Woesebacteria bacterium]|nr:phage holin family protein [Candidatus Woesebacteria bacterium]QQG47181.1 MAG: phage holin family protein [Candidatus Woesebacteria bacterium]